MAVAEKYTKEQKQAWKEEKQAEQRQLLEDALSKLTSSEAWTNWVRFGRSNLRKYSFHNALLIWSQKQEARLVRGRKQWQKENVTVQPEAKSIAIFAPIFGKVYDENGNIVLDNNGKPKTRVVFFKTVYVYDVSDTDAPPTTFSPMVTFEGDDHEDKLRSLESFSLELNILVRYREDTGSAHGWYDPVNSQIIVNSTLSPNQQVRTLVHELCHAYGNVNYEDFTREEAEVLVESATVMTLGMLDFDVSEASVPYIASWGADTKVLDKYAKLVEELVSTLTEKMGL